MPWQELGAGSAGCTPALTSDALLSLAVSTRLFLFGKGVE